MAKDRNTMAKRQREVEKRDKAVRKRENEKNVKRKSMLSADSSAVEDGQVRVLSIFRRYLMTTGQMLCLSGNEFESNKERLVKLVEMDCWWLKRSGWLFANQFGV